METLAKLNELLNYVEEFSPFYRKHFRPIFPNSFLLNSVEEITKLPFTTKDDLSKYNQDFLCVSKNKVADFITTSGTTGEPVSLFLTKKDLERLAENECSSFQMIGASENDVFQLMTTIDKRFMAGLAYFLGVQKLNAGIIRVGPGNPQIHWDSILKFEPTILISVPSFINNLIIFAKENKIDYKKSSVQKIICIGEPIRNTDYSYNALGNRITSDWEVKLYSTYASSEMGVAFTECDAGKGGHLNEELLILEVVDETDQQVKEGESGEIVITTLGVEGNPLIRFKTGDLAHVYYEKCTCGRKSPRLGPIIGRKNQMLKFKGTTIFPSTIFEVLDSFHEILQYKIEVEKDELENDNVFVYLDQNLEKKPLILALKEKFVAKIRVTPFIRYVETDVLRNMILKKNQRKPEKIVFL
jgi:phenylacetate-CoA ligase